MGDDIKTGRSTGEFENEKKKDKKILTFQSGDSNPRFSVILLLMILIFTKGEGDEIKSRQFFDFINNN